MSKVNLTVDVMGAHYAGDHRHAQVMMREMGITYQDATPQSMGDQWRFWNCEYTCDLPSYVTISDRKPMDCVGFGLSQEDAQRIADGE